ncbi:MAG: hypothetical protein WCH34_00100 [Bacteroidota bacterium]
MPIKKITKSIFSIFLFVIFIINLSSGQSTSKNHFKSFYDFYNFIYINSSSRILPYSILDTSSTTIKISNDTIKEIKNIRLENWTIKFISFYDTTKYPIWSLPNYYSNSYIQINDKILLPDSNNLFWGLEITNASIYNLNGITYIILHSYAPKCNGSFCLIEYDQIFCIKGNKIEYQIIEGLQFPHDIYCDINNDGQLDRISFNGTFTKKQNSLMSHYKEYYLVQPLIYQNNDWIPLKDPHGKNYFIFIQTDDKYEFKHFKILDFNWITKL